MSWFNKVKGRLIMLLSNKAKDEFNVKERTSDKLLSFIRECEDMYRGEPYWQSDEVHTINFAKAICSEVARLATMNIEVDVTGDARAEWLNERLEQCRYSWRQWVEYAGAVGTVILKPNGEGVDIVMPDRFIVTDYKNGQITGAVFVDEYYDDSTELYYTRMEWHRFEDGQYKITNKCYAGKSSMDTEREVDIANTRWAELAEETVVENVDKPLFGVLKMPTANNIEIGSPLGLPIFADAVREMKDLDIAYSLNAREIADSGRTVLLDSDRLLTSGGRVGTMQGEALVEQRGLPHYVKLVDGDGATSFYQEINPTLNTGVRLQGINALLSQIGYKCGFSNGYFVFNEKLGQVTATQVESDDRRTLQLIADIRQSLENCINGLVYALDKIADAYGDTPAGEYEVIYDFADLTLNEDEDRARWLSFVAQGWIPFWKYLVEFEGYSEEDAKELSQQQQQTDALEQLFMQG